MAKWTSPIFTDIRNKLGNSVVFSMWKGRPYFRSYVIPANPKTNKQTAHRTLLAELVKRYQTINTSDAIKAVWNVIALPKLISGYNEFVGIGRKTKIAAVTGTGSKEIDVTYTLGFAANKAKLYGKEGANYEDVTPAGGLEAGVDKTATVTMGSASTEYDMFIAHADALVEGDAHPQAYAAVTCWKPNETDGTVDVATADSHAA